MAQKSKRDDKKARPAATQPQKGQTSFRLPEKPAYVVAGLVLLHLILAFAVFDPTIFTGGDNGVYVALSRSLVRLRSYLSIHDPVATPHTYYPPGYPTILAIASLLGIKPWVNIKLITVAFSALAVAVSYLWLRRRTTTGVALFAVFVTAISPGLLAMSHYELSDIPFWALVTVSLWALEDMPRDTQRRVIIGGLAMAAAYLTRTAALPVIVAVLGWLAIEKRWKQAAIFAALVIPGMLWWKWWTTSNAVGNVYGNQFWYLEVYQPELGRASFIDLLARIPANAKVYSEVMLPLLFRGQQGPLALGALLLLLAIAGWAMRLRRFGLSEFVFPLYGAMLFLVPVPWAGERYTLPIIPLTLVYAAEAVLWGVRRFAVSLALPVGVIAASLFMVMALPAIAERTSAAGMCRSAHSTGEPYGCLPPEWQDYLSIADWAKTSLPKNAVVISRKPGLFFALSDRRGIDIPKTNRPEEFFRLAREAKARYIVLDRTDGLTSFYSVPVVANYVGSFCLVRAGFTPGTAVLGIHLDKPMTATPAGQQPNLVDCPVTFAEQNAN